jgi:hypothetical protein
MDQWSLTPLVPSARLCDSSARLCVQCFTGLCNRSEFSYAARRCKTSTAIAMSVPPTIV